MSHAVDDLDRAIQHARSVLPDVAADCVVSTLQTIRFLSRVGAIRDFIDRVLAIPSPPTPPDHDKHSVWIVLQTRGLYGYLDYNHAEKAARTTGATLIGPLPIAANYTHTATDTDTP